MIRSCKGSFFVVLRFSFPENSRFVQSNKIWEMQRSVIPADNPDVLITELKSGELRGNMRVALSDERRKTLEVIWFLKNKKSAIHVARLTIHEVGVRISPIFPIS